MKISFRFKLSAALFMLFFAIAVMPLPSFAQNADDTGANRQKTAEGAEVAPFGKTLFSVYGNVGVVSAEDRARIISKNIQELKKGVAFNPGLMSVTDNENSSDIMYADKIIAGVTREQAKIFSRSQNILANEYKELITAEVISERSKNPYLIIAKQAGAVLCILLAAFILIKFVSFIMNRAKDFILRKKGAKASELFDLEKHFSSLFMLLNVIKYALILFICHLCFISFLWFFPHTHGIAYKLLGYIKNPFVNALTAIWNYVPNLIEIIVILFFFQLFARVLKSLTIRVASGKIKIANFPSDWALPTYQIARILLIVFVFILIFPLLPKANSSVFKGISVFLGILVSLGSTTIISNIVSGFVITYMRPFSVGDRIKMGEHSGEVVEKSALVTRIRTSNNEIVTIPNSAILTATTTNYTNSAKTYGLILHCELSAGYENDWRQINDMLIEAALKTQYILSDPKPFVYQQKFNDFEMLYRLNAYTKEDGKMAFIYSELNKNILDVFNREKVEMLSPVYTAVRDGNPITIPEQYLKNASATVQKTQQK